MTSIHEVKKIPNFLQNLTKLQLTAVKNDLSHAIPGKVPYLRNEKFTVDCDLFSFSCNKNPLRTTFSNVSNVER
jgi:hypothetical protein